jgi:hypothetical protein
MDARELADKFSAKVAAAASELHHQETVATDSAKTRLDDVVHIKRAMEEQVYPSSRSWSITSAPSSFRSRRKWTLTTSL